MASKVAQCLHTGNIGDEFKISLFVQNELTNRKTEIKETFTSQNTQKYLIKVSKNTIAELKATLPSVALMCARLIAAILS